MSIEVDGERRQRGWREFQTVFGGAVLSCDLDGHRVEARITQPFQLRWWRQVRGFCRRQMQIERPALGAPTTRPTPAG